MALSQPLLDAKACRNSLIWGRAEGLSTVSSLLRRGSVSAINRVMKIAVKPPAFIPFCSRPPANSEIESGNIIP